MEDRLPADILYREKMGFAIPLATWFRGPLREVVRQRLLKGILSEVDLFDMGFIEQLIDDHCSGVSDFSTAIWALLMFESFLSNVHLGANTSSVQRATGT
jgi:asparagine synthase (glutamine-hydrolysing)